MILDEGPDYDHDAEPPRKLVLTMEVIVGVIEDLLLGIERTSGGQGAHALRTHECMRARLRAREIIDQYVPKPESHDD